MTRCASPHRNSNESRRVALFRGRCICAGPCSWRRQCRKRNTLVTQLTHPESQQDVHIAGIPLTHLAASALLDFATTTCTTVRVLNCPLPTPELKARLEIMADLNEVGRRYMLVDAGNKSRGVPVLQKVVDNLDCLFTHIRENPGLCS